MRLFYIENELTQAIEADCVNKTDITDNTPFVVEAVAHVNLVLPQSHFQSPQFYQLPESY